MSRLALFALLTLLACAHTPTAPSPSEPRAPTFIEDDAERAFADARTTGRPIFVDTWATWCHSCLALKAEVLTDPSLARFSDHFVWLSLDVEKEGAAPFLERFPQPAYPTLWIIRPDGTPLLRWVGTLTAPQLAELLTDALVAHSGAPAAAATRRLLEAEAAAAEGRHDDAIAGYRAALDTAPPDWPRRSRAANALAFVLSKLERHAECLALSLAEAPRAPPGAAGRPDLVIGGIYCAAALPAEDPARRPGLEALVPIARQLADDPSLLGDDRSGCWMAVVDGYKALGDEPAQKAASLSWVAFLESAAAAAPNAESRAVFDTHRMVAYLAVGRGLDALAALERSERDFPGDYNPPARKALVLVELGRLDEALASVDRALSLVYGPRRLRVRMTEATVHEKRKDPAAARRALETALAEADALPEAQRPTRLVADIQKRLAALPTSP